MNLIMLELAHPPGISGIDPGIKIGNWYDLLADPYRFIKAKCKSTVRPTGINHTVHNVCYIAGVFPPDKITSPSFADKKDNTLNNIILDQAGVLLQMYFETTRTIEDLGNKGMFKISVTEYKVGKDVVARVFNGYLE